MVFCDVELPFHDNISTIFPRRHFQMHFIKWKARISIQISPKFVPKGQINNIPVLIQKMAWRRPGDKPLSEPMLTHFTNAYMQH